MCIPHDLPKVRGDVLLQGQFKSSVITGTAQQVDHKDVRAVRYLLRDERGGELLEYALLTGLIALAAIATVGSVGSKVLARWRSLDSSM